MKSSQFWGFVGTSFAPDIMQNNLKNTPLADWEQLYQSG